MTDQHCEPAPNRPSGRRLFVRCAAPALMLAAAALSGCNRPRSADDIAVEIRLSRRFVRERTVRKPIEISCLDVGRLDIPTHGDAAWVVGAVITVMLVLAIVETAVRHAGTTRARTWPEEYPDLYRQRLGWGRNRIYLPRCFSGRTVPMVIEFRGNCIGTHRFQLDLTREGATRL